ADAIGARLSITVTTAEAEDESPAASVTVNTTVLEPTLEQSKDFLSIAKDTIPQLSELPLLTSLTEIDALPFASKATVIFFADAIGARLSTTVTIAEADDESPATSVTVKTTVFG